MSHFPATPKFISPETIRKPRITTCERCGAERPLPDGKVQLTEICGACMIELEYLLKKGMGTLKEGEERPRRPKPLLEAPSAPQKPLAPSPLNK